MTMFTWAIEAEAHAKATERDVWRAWTDVASWPKWDERLRWSLLEGPFAIGSKGKLKPKRRFASAFTITLAEAERRFVDCAKLPMTQLIFSHFVAPWWDGKVRIVHRIEVTGLFAPLLWLTLGRKMKKKLPETLQKLALHIESSSSHLK